MAGALPEASNGALPIRDSNGACLAPAGVTNAYCPPATFLSTCDLTALPNDCTAKIVPSQINGIVSEMLCFAATLSPFGTWNCTSTCNLSSMFTAWINSTADGGLTDTIGNVICNSAERAPILAGDMAIYCDGNGNLFKATEPNCFCPPDEVNGVPAGAPAVNDTPWRVDVSDTGNRILYYWNPATNAWRRIGDDAAGDICANPAARAALAACMADDIANAIAGDTTAIQTIADALISADAGNEIIEGTDGLLFAPQNRALFGIENVTGPGTIIAPVARASQATNTFVIPNNGPTPITVALNVRTAGTTSLSTGLGGRIEGLLYDGAGTGGAVLNGSSIDARITDVNLHVYQTAPYSRTAFLVIPPGGRTVTLEIAIAPSGLIAGGGSPSGGTLQNMNVQAQWYGVSHAASN